MDYALAALFFQHFLLETVSRPKYTGRVELLGGRVLLELTYVLHSKHLRRRPGWGGKQGVLQVQVQVSTRVRHLSTAEREQKV